MHKDPKSAKKLLNLTVFMALLGSARIKAARKTLVKLKPCPTAVPGWVKLHLENTFQNLQCKSASCN